MMKFQKGQLLVEFAIILPLFLLFIQQQQFTAFKPLAHRPKPMLAKP